MNSSFKQGRFKVNPINRIVYDSQSEYVCKDFHYGWFFMIGKKTFIFYGNDDCFYELDESKEANVFIYSHPSCKKNSQPVSDLGEDAVMLFAEVKRFKDQMEWWKKRCEAMRPRKEGCCLVA